MLAVTERLRHFRQLKGWSQEEVAEKLGMSVNGYANIERGETDLQLSRLEQIAQLFEIPPQAFLSTESSFWFYLSGTQNNQSHWQVASNSDPRLAHEVEKLTLVVAQQQKEIALLNEIITLLRAGAAG
jgi:transcriptional regulator with XRE-family HTH domain